MASGLKIGIVCYPSLGGSGVVATELGNQMPVDPDPTGHSTGTERTGAGAVDKVQGIAWPPVRAGAA